MPLLENAREFLRGQFGIRGRSMRQVGAQAIPFEDTVAGIAVHDVECERQRWRACWGAAGHASEQPRRESAANHGRTSRIAYLAMVRQPRLIADAGRLLLKSSPMAASL